MLAIGGVFGILIGLNIIFGGLNKYIIIVLVLSGLLGTARIYENAHNHAQIYIGFILGVTTGMSSILLF